MTPAAALLLEPWPGPCGGLPPFDRVTPESLEEACTAAIEDQRRALQAIAGLADPPTFANTIEALEDCARPVRRLAALLHIHAATAATGAMPEVVQRLAPKVRAVEDEAAHNAGLFARVEAVHQGRESAGLDAEQRRLVEVIHARMLRAGARLDAGSQRRLRELNAGIAAECARFVRNLAVDGESQLVWLEQESDLAGLPAQAREAAAAAAAARGRPDAWVVTNQRPAVWGFLIHSTRRDLRERVWRMWMGRGGHDGATDNRPVITRILALRGEKARLLGYPSYAHYATADRMIGGPEAALDLLLRTWQPVHAATLAQIAAYREIAAEDGHDFELEPWDRLHYAERLRSRRFGVNAEEVRDYLDIDRVIEAMFWSAGRLHGLEFRRLDDVPLIDPAARCYEVSRGGEPVGVLYLDLHSRPGKSHGSFQAELRPAESYRERVLPVSYVVSGLPPPTPGQPTLLPWEYANVLFHEFGHALHMLSSRSRYPSLGPLAVAWDFVELPSLLNERWLRDRELLARHALHHRTGDPLPGEFLERIERSLQHERIFSVNLDFLSTAIVEMKLHLQARGDADSLPDPVEFERATLAELGMPRAWDQVMCLTNCVHAFGGEQPSYAAGLYSYLWSDVMAADVAEAFLRAPQGLWDAEVARRWRDQVLEVGHTVPAASAVRSFLGRDPDPDALLRRFALRD